MESGESKQLEPAILTAWHHTYASRLSAFVLGILKDPSLVEEVVQLTFTKAFTRGGEIQPGAEKAWLFQVAYREALTILRKSKVNRKSLEQLRSDAPKGSQRIEFPLLQLLREEQVEEIQKALLKLSENNRIVVKKRIYEEKTFQQIADELKIPLGTVLTRMRSALSQLRTVLNSNSQQ